MRRSYREIVASIPSRSAVQILARIVTRVSLGMRSAAAVVLKLWIIIILPEWNRETEIIGTGVMSSERKAECEFGLEAQHPEAERTTPRRSACLVADRGLGCLA